MARPDVLAYPSPTTSRFLVFLAALLTAGAFVGGWLHNQVLGDEWVRTVARCQQEGRQAPVSGTGLPAEIQRNAADEHCRAPVERRRAAFSFGGALLAGVAGLLVLFAAPGVLERRRHLRALVPALAGAGTRAGELAHDLGVRRVPTLMLGPATLRDAFSYGTPRHYRIALPPAAAVRWRDASLFDPLVGHELAHIEHRDVALAWLARSVWYALAPLLALPVIAGLVSGDLSLLPDYAWRAALLAVTVQLTSSALLRSREHDADLRAAQAQGPGGPGAVEALLGRAQGRPVTGWRAPLAKHPAPADRIAVLQRPQLAARITLLDGLTTGFLAGLSLPVVVSVVTTLLIGSGHTDRAQLIAACLAGPLLAGSVGLGLCRAAVVARVDGSRAASPVPVALGVAGGLALGEAASLAQAGAGVASLSPGAWLPVLAALGFGVTLLVASLAELLADAAPLLRRARASWLIALAVTALAFTAVLWVGTMLATPMLLGWSGVVAWLVTELRSGLVLAALAAVTLAALWGAWAARVPRTAPAWILERAAPRSPPAPGEEAPVPWPRTGDEAPVPWPRTGDEARGALLGGLAAGLAGAIVIVGYRAIEGAPATDALREQRYYLDLWMAGAAALAGALPAAWARSPRGAGLAAPAAVTACLVTVAGWLALNTALGGAVTGTFVSGIARPPLALSLLAIVIAAPAMLLPAGWRAAALALPAGALVLAACAAVLIHERATLVPLGGSAAIGGSLPSAASPADVDAQLYATSFAPAMASGYLDVKRAVAAIDADRSLAGGARASRLIRDVITPLRGMYARARAYRAASPAVATVNTAAVTAIKASLEAYAGFAAAYATGDAAGFQPARTALARSEQDWGLWLSAVNALGGAAP